MGIMADLGRTYERARSMMFPGVGVGYFSTNLWRVPEARYSQDYMKLYGEVGWLFATVSKISSSVAATQWKIVQANGAEVSRQHPSVLLLRHANPVWTTYDLFEHTQMYMDLVGEAFWLLGRDKLGRPRMIFTLPPHRVDVIPSENLAEFVAGYAYRSPIGESVPLAKNEIIHFKNPNPLNQYRGLSPVQAALYDVDAEGFAAQYMRNYFYNNATPGGFIKTGTAYNEQEHKRLVEQFERRHGGPEGAGRLGVLWGDMEYTVVEVNPKQTQLIEVRKLLRDQILGIYGMPRSVMGITEDVNRANAEAGYYIYAREVILPRLMRFKSVIDEHYLPMFGPGLEWVPNNPVPEDRVALTKEAVDTYTAGIVTRNEARKIIGLAPFKDGDLLLIPTKGSEKRAKGFELSAGTEKQAEETELEVEVPDEPVIGLPKVEVEIEVPEKPTTPLPGPGLGPTPLPGPQIELPQPDEPGRPKI